MRSTPTVGYYSALEKEEVLEPATVWTDLEDTMKMDASQTQKDNSVESMCTRHPDQASSQGQKVDARWPGSGRGMGSWRLMGTGFLCGCMTTRSLNRTPQMVKTANFMLSYLTTIENNNVIHQIPLNHTL